jgi:hypothetical protein
MLVCVGRVELVWMHIGYKRMMRECVDLDGLAEQVCRGVALLERRLCVYGSING